MAVIALSAILAAVKGGVGLIGAGKIAILPFLIAAMTYFHYDQFDPENRPVDREEVDAWYDFIIIGGGSAGSVLANRLTEIPNWKVLLLEAGGQETEISDVPILSLYLHKSKLDWGYKTEPSDSACQAMIEKRCSWTRGKVLGGSSVLNTMLYIRGNRRDYDRWAAYGNRGWSFQEVLPYFKKSEDQRNPYLARDKRYHSTGVGIKTKSLDISYHYFFLSRSKDPLDYPLLYHNYLSHPHDVNVLREGTKAAVAYGQTEALRRFGARFHAVPPPNCKHLPLYTDEYWDCYIRQYTLSIYHYSCTAKMGPENDPWAVVDPELRVSITKFLSP
nr:unnamed protein product [Callosobruchus chinensis]